MNQKNSAIRSPKELAEMTGNKNDLIKYALNESENILRDTWWMTNALKAYRDNKDFVVKDMDVVLAHAMNLGNKDIIQLALWSGGKLNPSKKHHPAEGFKIPTDWQSSADLNDLPKTEEDEILHASLYFHERLKELAQDGEISQEDANELIDLAIYTNTPKYFDLAMNFNPDLNAIDEKGKTLLHHVSDNPVFTEQLIRYGANPNIQDVDGCTPLMYAMLNGNSDVVETLIKGGADLSIKDHTGAKAEEYIKSADLLFAYQKLMEQNTNSDNKDIVKHHAMQNLKDNAEQYPTNDTQKAFLQQENDIVR